MSDAALNAFRDFLLARGREEPAVRDVVALTGPEARADLAVRWVVADRAYYDTRVDLARGIVEPGFSTESRVLNETIEQGILDSRDELPEIINDELYERGEREEVEVLHFFERPAFRFTARLPLTGPEALSDPQFRQRVLNCLAAFQAFMQRFVEEE